MTTYFGNTTGVDSPNYAYNLQTIGNNQLVWQCPGSGAQNVDELQAYSATDGTANIRLAIYTTGGVFVMQGSAAVALSGSWGWRGHTAFVDQAGDPITTPQLTGGTNYWLVVTSNASSGNPYIGYATGSANDAGKNVSDDHTGGFPASLSWDDGTGVAQFCIRCGVTPAVSYPAYYHGSLPSLPSDDSTAGLTAFISGEYTAVSEVDGVYAFAAGSGLYLIQMFVQQMTADVIPITWTGRMSTAPSSRTATLQVYNRDSSTWVSLATNNTAGAGEQFTLTYTLTSSTTPTAAQCRGVSNILASRVYQQAT